MKKTTFIILTFFCFSGLANAQFFKKLGDKIEKAAEKSVEQRVEQKTRKATEKAFDSTFNKKIKNKKGSTNISTISKVNSPENYSFKHKAVMKMQSGKQIQDFEYYLPETNTFFGVKIKDEKMKDELTIVYDSQLETIFTFMENNGQKFKMGVEFKTNTTSDETAFYEIKATGNSKTIIGYHSKEYKIKGEKVTATIWVTKDVDFHFPSTFQSHKKGENINQAWMKDIEGWVMEMDMIDTSKRKPQTITMQCLSITQSNLEINSSNYNNLRY
ncbi:DUF4412 domain-containing protein [Algibacter pacificus]|uniref:DUF4412 domain-containing protein n=1 Tax=Algibacter pacificus TaxID=2599389 RepID=UPI0011CCA916|nr:DUF4412 domain-containing protein [Algibacter pacificus]